MNLGSNDLTKILIYEGDNEQEVVNDFCLRHNLTEEKKSKLLKVVQDQLSALLHKIEESGEEDEEYNDELGNETHYMSH